MKVIVGVASFFFICKAIDCQNISYVPGDLTVRENGLLLSTGLKSKIIAESGKPLPVTDQKFITLPDGAACFPTNEGGWVYVINSEDSDKKGGVGAIYFNSTGQMVDYKVILKNTSRNCSGGKTPWNTWVSCEESRGGQCFECDPNGIHPATKTVLGDKKGGRFEAVAYDEEFNSCVTEDSAKGALRRYTPDKGELEDTLNTTKYWKVLQGNNGSIDYLVLNPDTKCSGSFKWTSNHNVGRSSARKHFPNTEGIEYYNRKIYFTAKKNKVLIALNLQSGFYEATSTTGGLFDGQPDQIKVPTKHIKHLGGTDIMHFTEDFRSSGIHTRDLKNGKFFTVAHSLSHKSETTGIAFSPDMRHFYFCIQKAGLCFDITRVDGLGFGNRTLDVVYW